MDRIEKTKEYLKQQRATFQNFESLRNSKNEFFDRIKQFKEVTIDNLTKFKTIQKKDLDEFGEILRQFEAQRSKGLGTAVYWQGTGSQFDKALSKIDELLLNLDKTKLSLRIMFLDHIKEVFSSPIFTRTIITGVILTFLSYFIYLIIDLLKKHQ